MSVNFLKRQVEIMLKTEYVVMAGRLSSFSLSVAPKRITLVPTHYDHTTLFQ